MSSESSSGSTTSRIRQFGLYRSIDARTEEFLRLSMKRQIRQGCACAAVSTAITITVVVVVFVVYEFSLNPEINLDSSIKANWLNLMNVTKEGQTFDSNFPKNLDQGSLQLLPMLIKAYKKNVIIEKVVEDSSSNPLNDRKYTTTDDFNNKAIFTRNWLRLPASKLFTIEYKTSPVVYYRTPTENIKYFTKIRKIRNDQRLINYVDKMINEKSSIGSTKPMIKGQIFRMTETTPKKSDVTTRQSKKPVETTTQNMDSFKETVKSYASKYETTPHNMDSFKERLISNDTTSKNVKAFKETTIFTETTPNNVDAFKQTFKPNVTYQLIQNLKPKVLSVTKEGTKPSTCKCSQTMSTLLQKILTTIQNAIPRTAKITPIQNISKETVTKDLAQTELKTTTQKTTIKQTANGTIPLQNVPVPNNLNMDEQIVTTTSPQLIEGTEYNDILVPRMTKPMYRFNDPRYLEDDNIDISIESLVPRKRLDMIGHNLQLKNKTEDDTKIKRQPIFFDDKQFTNLNHDTKGTPPYFLKGLNIALYKLIEQNIKRLAQSINIELSAPTTSWYHKNYRSNKQTTWTEIPIPNSSLTLTTPTSTEKHFETSINNNIKKEVFEKTTTTTTEKVVTPKFSLSSWFSPLTSPFTLPSTTTVVSPLATSFKINNLTIPLAPKANTTDVLTPNFEVVNWEELKTEDVPAWKSMLPINRPVYLEIHRNDFKRSEDPSDFDYNMNNAAYDVI